MCFHVGHVFGYCGNTVIVCSEAQILDVKYSCFSIKLLEISLVFNPMNELLQRRFSPGQRTADSSSLNPCVRYRQKINLHTEHSCCVDSYKFVCMPEMQS